MCFAANSLNNNNTNVIWNCIYAQKAQKPSSCCCCVALYNNNSCQINNNSQQSGSSEDTRNSASLTRTPAFNAKYRRKYLLLLWLLIAYVCYSRIQRVAGYNCTAHAGRCQNDGECQEDGQCLCADGWQGPECQFCGGKVRLVRLHKIGLTLQKLGPKSLLISHHALYA